MTVEMKHLERLRQEALQDVARLQAKIDRHTTDYAQLEVRISFKFFFLLFCVSLFGVVDDDDV